MLTISELYIYPVKSLGSIPVERALLTATGFENDRRMAVIDGNNTCLTQRTLPAMALLQPVPASAGFYIHHRKNIIPPLFVPLHPGDAEPVQVTVWEDTCDALLYPPAVHSWFSQALQTPCRLVWMPDTTHRGVDMRYAFNGEITSFADAYPLLMIGQASLDDLNARLSLPVPMSRFRPNIVFRGGNPFAEDEMNLLTINGVDFRAAKPCSRCVMTTLDQDTLLYAKEPLKTLAGYRSRNHKILFGQNLLHQQRGYISIGDTITIKSRQQAII